MANADYTISPYGRAECPVCGREFNLTKKGVMRQHVNLDRPAFDGHMYCEGVGRAPGVVTLPVVEEPTPEPVVSVAERRRRLDADIEDARKALNRAQAHFNKLCDESAALRRAEQEV